METEGGGEKRAISCSFELKFAESNQRFATQYLLVIERSKLT